MGRYGRAEASGGDREGRHLDRMDRDLVRLLPAAPCQGHGRRGFRRGGHEGGCGEMGGIPGGDEEGLTGPGAIPDVVRQAISAGLDTARSPEWKSTRLKSSHNY